MSKLNDLQNSLLAVLFSSSDAITEKKLASIYDLDKDQINSALVTIQEHLEDIDSGIVLKKIAGGWRLFASSKYSDIIKKYVVSLDSRKLSNAAIETLAIIAYSQPITRANIAAIRGVNSDSSVNGLVEKGLVKESGYADMAGNPTLYSTTNLFLEHFGLNSVSDLPSLDTFAPDDETVNLIEESLCQARVDKNLVNYSNDDDGLSNNLNDNVSINNLQQAEDKISEDDFKQPSEVFNNALQSAFGATEKIDFNKIKLDTDNE